MSQNEDGLEKKIQGFVEKMGVWMFLALVSMCIFQFNVIEKRISATERAVGRLHDGKVSKVELKEVQESFLRETQLLRQDVRDGFSVLRNDMNRRDAVSPKPR